MSHLQSFFPIASIILIKHLNEQIFRNSEFYFYTYEKSLKNMLITPITLFLPEWVFMEVCQNKRQSLCLPCNWSHLVQDLLHFPPLHPSSVQQKQSFSILKASAENSSESSGVYFLDMNREDRGVECFRQSLCGKLVERGRMAADGFPFLVALCCLN